MASIGQLSHAQSVKVGIYPDLHKRVVPIRATARKRIIDNTILTQTGVSFFIEIIYLYYRYFISFKYPLSKPNNSLKS